MDLLGRKVRLSIIYENVLGGEGRGALNMGLLTADQLPLRWGLRGRGHKWPDCHGVQQDQHPLEQCDESNWHRWGCCCGPDPGLASGTCPKILSHSKQHRESD